MRILFFYILLLSATMAHASDYLDKKEAEEGRLTNCNVVTGSNFSGGKAVRLTDAGASLTVTVNVQSRKRYKVVIAGNGVGGEKYVNCSVDGNNCQFRLNTYKEVEIGTLILNEGANEITITPNWTWFDIDYVCLKQNDVNIDFNVSERLVDSKATEAACTMYSFLKRNFGTKTISGMMTGEMLTGTTDICKHKDMQAVYNASGKYPALVGFDFMNSTGKNENEQWMKNYSTTALNLAKDTYRKGGLPAFTWHWRDPSRATDAFYSDQSSVRISSALNSDGTWNTSSSLYKNIINDIDKIAGFFLEMQNEGMACLFRPLHEADGGWFWWGRDGAQNFRKLYQLVYNEMVNVKGVHNVIWIWNAGPDKPEWNPGDEYYDIVSADIYNAAYDYSSCYPTFDKLKELTSGKKIIALSENGPIPDIQREVDDEAVWSWWMPWYNTWDGGYVGKTSKGEWTSCMSDPRVITLEDLSGGWASQTAIENHMADQCSMDKVYNLSGQAVRKATTPGIYIVNGKKTIIK